MTLAREQEQDTTCPICLESLSIRLTGEKPHVIPLCGHKLHNECFETAYNITVSQAIGDSPHSSVMNELGGGGGGGSLLSSARRKKKSIGICGICRSEMKIGDPGELGKNSE